MAVRVNKLGRECDIGLQTLKNILDALGYDYGSFDPSIKVSDSIAELIVKMLSKDIDPLKLLDEPYRKIIRNIKSEKFVNSTITYSDTSSFWIDELVICTPDHKANFIHVGSFDEAKQNPLFSLIIGTNGVGKSILLREIVDFFIDLHYEVSHAEHKTLQNNNNRLKGIKYHIDGVECNIIEINHVHLAWMNGQIRNIKDLRLPSIVACHFGAFDKFPKQKVNGSMQTRYDVPFYKYVGAHVNGNVISSSAIIFRLMFSLSKQMDNRQHENIKSILDFIGYDHKISLSLSLVNKTRKNSVTKNTISQRVAEDRQYQALTDQEKSLLINQFDNYYKTKRKSKSPKYRFEIDFDSDQASTSSHDELQIIYKLKQYDLVKLNNIIFHKQGIEIQPDEMSSGEFAILSTVLSISAASNDPHTLVLLDEPELSLHPNWQMTIIDNLDRALANRACHLIIATHSHMLVSDLPMQRSFVCQLDRDADGNLISTSIPDSTYGWSAEEVLLKVFKTATDRNRYFGERIGKLLERIGENTIKPDEIQDEVHELNEISQHLNDIDPMKQILNTIIKAYN